VVGQLLRYVGALREEYGWERIRGFIVTEQIDKTLRFSFRELVSATGKRRNWKLYRADFRISFEAQS
jgi:hypothetical protein